MSNESKKVQAKTEVRTAEGKLVNPEPQLAPSAPPPEGQLSFSMYVVARKIPVQRQAGMRAFTKINEATLAEWDAIFKRY